LADLLTPLLVANPFLAMRATLLRWPSDKFKVAWRTAGKLHEWKVAFAVDLNQREIGLLVGADDLGRIACTIVRLWSQLQARSEGQKYMA
jgi:hypothetical protein